MTGKFVKGQPRPAAAGRKAGTPNKSTAEVKALAASYGPRAVRRLVQLMDSDDPKAAIAACRELLDRGFGKPQQEIELATPDLAGALDWTALIGDRHLHVHRAPNGPVCIVDLPDNGRDRLTTPTAPQGVAP